VILVDTSVWVDHFRSGNAKLGELLADGVVLMHPFVVGELACGTMRNRVRILGDLQALPTSTLADHREVLRFVDTHRLWGRGIGWTDCHLLASAQLSGCALWTLDRPLRRAAAAIGL